MDDLYSNAWSDPADPPLPALKPSTSSGTSWLSPSLTSGHEEADLAAPSWSTGSGIAWNEPSDSAGFSWGQADTDLAWGNSAYDDIKIGKSASIPVHDEPHVPEDQETEEREAEEQEVVEEEHTEEHTAEEQGPSPDVEVDEDAREAPSPAVEQVSPSEVPLAAAEILAPPVENDAFGTFESALVPDEDAAVALEESDINADAWGSAWANDSETSDAHETDSADEWEAARQRKAQLDRRVPPAVIAGLLRDTEQFCEDTWPDIKPSDAAETDKWKDTWRRGIEGVDGLEALVNTFLPPLSLQPPVHFGKTSTGKHMASSVRQTKNLAMSKRSPMAYYLAAKGSTAWEVAVKERKESVTDDLPAGWRILEKDATKDTATSAVKDKKPAGRLFSFWGRRESSNAHSRSSSQSDAKAETSLSPTLSEQAGHSRRPSQDSVMSLGGSSADKNISPTTQSSSSLAPSADHSTTSIASAPSRSTSYADAPEPQVDPDNIQAPSAVSRFLNRFSRRHSTMGSGSPRNSLALSSDDLEFLSEIPSADDGEDDEDASMKAFESVFNSKPQPSVLLPPLPPPLPPPPSVNTGSRNALNQATSSLHSPMDSLDSNLGLLDSMSFTAAFPAVAPSSSSAAPLQPVMAMPVLQPSRPSTPPVPLQRKDARSASPSPLTVERKATPAQPFFLPSPPSSRSHTPIPAVRSSLSGVSRSQTPPVTQGASSSRSSPPSFPPSRAHAVSDSLSNPPDTPTSSMPLAQLYPDAYRAQADNAPTSRPASRAHVSGPFVQPPSVPSGFGGALPPLLAPPPAPLRPTSATPPLIPPPAPSRPTSVPPASIPPRAVPRQSPTTPPPSVPTKPTAPPKPALSLNLHGAADNDDDEEFSDFLSSATVPTSSKPLVRSFSISSRTSTPGKTTPMGLGRTGGRPPPLAHFRIGSMTSQRSVSGTPPPPAKPSLLDDVDDFSDFQESPATSQPQSSKPFKDYFGDFRSPVSSRPLQSFPSYSSAESIDSGANDSIASDNAFVAPKTDLGFDFLGSYTSSLRTPSPPRPISKTSHAPRAPAPPSSSQPTRSVADASSSRASKAASHLHTLNLMEKAASRPGRWPAPPSPLPPILPGPGWAPSSTASVDLLGDDGSPGRPKAGSVAASQTPALVDPFGPAPALVTGNGNPLVLRGPSLLQSQSSQSLQSLALGPLHRMGTPPAVGQPAMAPAVNSQTRQSAVKTGGLSAQDLMFFEGL